MKQKGDKITTAEELLKQTKSKHKSVYVKHWGRATSVSFIISMQFRAVMWMLKTDKIFKVKEGD